jgi:hypothetical protein
VAGGSLLQLLVPAVFAGYFWRRRDAFAAGVTLMWLGLNFLDVAIYAADAIALDLPLLGGDSSGHDWNYLLRVSGTLAYTDAVAWSLRALGSLSLWGRLFPRAVGRLSSQVSRRPRPVASTPVPENLPEPGD